MAVLECVGGVQVGSDPCPSVVVHIRNPVFADKVYLVLSHGYIITLRNFVACNAQTAMGVNTMKPRQNGRHFADDIFKCIFLYQNV